MDKFGELTQRSHLLIFAYAPAGFGHLRVTDALYLGLQNQVTPILLGSQDETIRFVHRITSTHKLATRLFEWSQDKMLPTELYRFYLRNHTKLLYQQLVTILDQRIDTAEEIILIATHFGLAHQLAAIKKKIEIEKNVRMFLFVQVTDDSPQPIWYVQGATMIFVPSYKTKAALERYGRKVGLPLQRFQVSAYPVSPSLTKSLSEAEHHERLDQVHAGRHAKTHVAIPLSGAAVGTAFLELYITALHSLSDRYFFHIVTKQAPYTQPFIRFMQHKPYLQLEKAISDQDVVSMYDTMYQAHTISLEVTKPSEQTFKALCTPKQRGGAMLLLSQPVGKQEYDNINFLQRHFLLPSIYDQQRLWDASQENKAPDESLLHTASSWRGLLLPKDPAQAAMFTQWCLSQGIFSRMAQCLIIPTRSDPHAPELNSHGVQTFWDTIETFLEENEKKRKM